MKWVFLLVLVFGIGGGAMMIPIGGGIVPEKHLAKAPASSAAAAAAADTAEVSSAPPDRPLRLLFIHHSCGGRWLAAEGPDRGEDCIYTSHPDGGGLRAALEADGYEVHEASYGSRIGAATDIFDWPDKFRTEMDAILSCARQDRALPDGQRNHIVMFKSCFPNNLFRPSGRGPAAGDPRGPELTVPNAQAAYRALLPEFARYPRVLFVCVTAPPMAPKLHPERLGKRLARKVLGRPSREAAWAASAREARRFNDWLKHPEGWLAEYEGRNVVVFDLYDELTDHGASDLLRYPGGDGYDSHPNREGNAIATASFVPFLNRAVRRSGLFAPEGD